MKRKYIFCIVFLLIIEIVFQRSVMAQTELTDEPTGILSLEQALLLALKKNPELAVLFQEIQAKDALKLQSVLRPNPELSLEMENFLGTEELSGVKGLETTLKYSQLFERGEKRFKRAHVAALNKELAQWDYKGKQRDVIAEVKEAFVDVLVEQERLSLLLEITETTRQVYDAVSARVKAGKVPPIEETKAKIALTSNEVELKKAEEKLKGLKKRLSATWGSTETLFQGVTGNLHEIPPLDDLQKLTLNSSQNPDSARWETEFKQRASQLMLEETKKVPDFTFSAGLRHFKETDDKAFLVEFSMPLLLYDKNPGGILEAKTLSLKAQYEKKAAETKIYAQLSETYQEATAAHKEILALKDQVLPLSTSVFKAISEGYRLGKFGYLDVLDAQRTLFEMKLKFLEALGVYHKALVGIERLVGKFPESLKDSSEQK